MKRIPITKPYIDENEILEIIDTLKSGWYTTGPKTKKFEDNFAKYVGADYAVGTNSCTSGLLLSLMALNIGLEDEVITTNITCQATTNVIEHLGAKPILVDVDQDTVNIDIDQIEEKITDKTKAIIPVHYGGNPCDMDRIKKIAKNYGLYVIEDAAHAIGSTYKGQPIGSISDITVFSFHPTKTMTTGEGGMITTNSKELAEKIRLLSTLGFSTSSLERYKHISWEYDMNVPGIKCNMNDLSASIGIHQLKKHNDFLIKRKEISNFYDQTFKDFECIKKVTPILGTVSSNYIYPIILDKSKLKINRDEFIKKLNEKFINISVHFKPISELSYYKNKYGFNKQEFPNSNEIYENILSIPIYPYLSKEEYTYIANTFVNIIKENEI